MNEKRTSLEVIALSVEEAINKGLSDLGLPEEAVDVEILDEGSRGLFGLGGRQARIRLSVKTTETNEAEPHTPSLAVEPPPAEIPIESKPELSPVADEAEEEDQILRVARETVTELLEKMKVKSQVSAYYGEADDARSKVPVHVDITGDDLSILIGRRAEILNALQYITRLIIGKELGRSVPLVVDVEGYRKRREQQIRQLARRMADQAIKTGRRQILEPMPPNERRLVHIELRNNSEVSTESIGEEPRRKVTILPY